MKKLYYITIDGNIYTRPQYVKGGTRTMWDRACDVANSCSYRYGHQKYFDLKNSGRLIIHEVKIEGFTPATLVG